MNSWSSNYPKTKGKNKFDGEKNLGVGGKRNWMVKSSDGATRKMRKKRTKEETNLNIIENNTV